MGFFSKGIPKKSVIVFDLDNTLVDEFGATVRPGMAKLLKVLKTDYRLILWTNSMRQRALDIMAEHQLRIHFEKCIFREDYDPKNEGLPKDLRKISGKFIIDDDPAEVEFNRRNGIAGFLISPYRKQQQKTDDGMAERILKLIRG